MAHEENIYGTDSKVRVSPGASWPCLVHHIFEEFSVLYIVILAQIPWSRRNPPLALPHWGSS